MKKHIIVSIITAIIVALIILSFFFFVPWLKGQEDREAVEKAQEMQR